MRHDTIARRVAGAVLLAGVFVPLEPSAAQSLCGARTVISEASETKTILPPNLPRPTVVSVAEVPAARFPAVAALVVSDASPEKAAEARAIAEARYPRTKAKIVQSGEKSGDVPGSQNVPERLKSIPVIVSESEPKVTCVK